jgi:hypothetical protein
VPPGKRFKPPATGKLADKEAEQVRQNHDLRIRELQNIPVVGGKLIKDIELESDVLTPVAHGLGRRATVLLSPPRGVDTIVRIAATPAGQESTTAAVTEPDGGTDYWTFGGTTRIAYPLPVVAGERLLKVQLYFYRGSGLGNPTIRVLGGSTGASATVLTPAVAWTNPSADTTWELLAGGYDDEINSARAVLDVASGNGSRLRQALVHVRGTPAVQEVRSSDYDPAQYVVLRATGFASNEGIVKVDAWVF